MFFLAGSLSVLVVTLDNFFIHWSSEYLVLHTDDTVTEGNFLLQLSTFLLKNINWLGRKYTAHLSISGNHFFKPDLYFFSEILP